MVKLIFFSNENKYLLMSIEELFRVFSSIYSEDVRFKILRVLASREAVNLRELSKVVGMDHKSVHKYLKKLVDSGLVREIQVSSASRVYELNGEYNFLRELFRRIQ